MNQHQPTDHAVVFLLQWRSCYTPPWAYEAPFAKKVPNAWAPRAGDTVSCEYHGEIDDVRQILLDVTVERADWTESRPNEVFIVLMMQEVDCERSVVVQEMINNGWSQDGLAEESTPNTDQAAQCD